jgi:DNA topoisomerase VI subunit B
VLQRQTFTVARASEYFSARELQVMTGQPREAFAAVALKELADNALDACEAAGVAPCLTLEVNRAADLLTVVVQDSGNRLPLSARPLRGCPGHWSARSTPR